jgi:hypothetical protein
MKSSTLKAKYRRSPQYKMSRKERVDRQAVQLVKERIRLFGDQWQVYSAIRVPEKTLKEIREIGAVLWLQIEEGTL